MNFVVLVILLEIYISELLENNPSLRVFNKTQKYQTLYRANEKHAGMME